MRKQITLTVVVSGPSWMTREMAKKEVRSLLNEQCFFGHENPNPRAILYDAITNDNFRVRKIQ